MVQEICKNVSELIVVAGNHEYYSSSIHRTDAFLKELSEEIPNFHVLNNDVYINEDEKIAIVGSTLWSDLSDPLHSYDASVAVNDFKYIRFGNSEADAFKYRFKPEHSTSLFHKNVKYLKETIKYYKDNAYKVLVVTHHAPSFLSIDPRYEDSRTNNAYASDLSDLILELEPEYWLHGHIHTYKNYFIGKTNIICNPLGYENEKTFFEPKLEIVL